MLVSSRELCEHCNDALFSFTVNKKRKKCEKSSAVEALRVIDCCQEGTKESHQIVILNTVGNVSDYNLY